MTLSHKCVFAASLLVFAVNAFFHWHGLEPLTYETIAAFAPFAAYAGIHGYCTRNKKSDFGGK